MTPLGSLLFAEEKWSTNRWSENWGKVEELEIEERKETACVCMCVLDINTIICYIEKEIYYIYIMRSLLSQPLSSKNMHLIIYRQQIFDCIEKIDTKLGALEGVKAWKKLRVNMIIICCVNF